MLIAEKHRPILYFATISPIVHFTLIACVNHQHMAVHQPPIAHFKFPPSPCTAVKLVLDAGPQTDMEVSVLFVYSFFPTASSGIIPRPTLEVHLFTLANATLGEVTFALHSDIMIPPK